MRNLIPRLQVSVARNRARADRMLAELVLGQEVFLTRLTDDLLKVTDSNDPDTARVLGVVMAEWSDRIAAAEASGRQCRAWYVGELAHGKSFDGTFRILLTVWCSTSSQTGWREIGVEELLRTARVQDEATMPVRQQRGPAFTSRINDAIPRRRPLVIGDHGQASPVDRSQTPDTGATPSASRIPGATGRADAARGAALSAQQVDLIKDAVLRKLDKLKPK